MAKNDFCGGRAADVSHANKENLVRFVGHVRESLGFVEIIQATFPSGGVKIEVKLLLSSWIKNSYFPWLP